MEKNHLVYPLNANVKPLTIFPHTAPMISNAYANTHSSNTIASRDSVADLLVSSVVALLVHGPALAAPSSLSMKQWLRPSKNERKKARQRTIWDDSTMNLII